jgi:hypothetical protein
LIIIQNSNISMKTIKSHGNVFTGMQLDTENTDIEDVSLVAEWQPCVDPEPLKEDEWIDTDIDTPVC